MHPETGGTRHADTRHDEELVAAVLRKDRKAAAELVSLHADVVCAYVRRRLIPREDMAGDLVREVFVAAWEQLGAFRATWSLRGRLIGIARHRVEGYYRSRLRDTVLPSDLDDDLPVEMTHTPRDEEAMDRAQLEAKIRRVLASLPETSSLVLLWRYWERRSAREMAAQTGDMEKGLERVLARAGAQFRERWNGE